ncbi:MAG: hypothetical protein IKB40_03520 [Paludibacteraceae bacterium]|nr:hypothetical protein [Paludibacteraceae bacterium]
MTTTKNNKVIGLFGFSAENLDIFRELFDASVEINLFELPRENTKDTVKQVDNFYVHQYEFAEQNVESRINEILRDMLAIHADYYFISSQAQFHQKAYNSLVHYGYKVVVM